MSERLQRLTLLTTVLVVVPVLFARTDLVGEAWWLAIGFGATYSAMALSLNILMGYAGQISLGHGGLIAAGAYGAALLASRASLPFAVGLIGAGLAAGLLAFVVGLPALRLRGLYLAITTIGFVVAMEQSILQLPVISRGSAGVALPRPSVGAFSFAANGDWVAVLFVAVIVLWVLDQNVLASRFGRGFHGIREDEEVASSFGVDVRSFKLLAFVLSGVAAGIAGALHGHLVGFVGNETFGLQFSLSLLAWVIIGGLGSRAGVVTAAAIFGFFPEILDRVFDIEFLSDFQFVVGAGLLMATVVLNPNGFAGALRHRREQLEMKEAMARLGEVDEDDVPTLPEFPRVGGAPVVADDQAVLEVRGVTVQFGGLVAVNNADIDVPAGQIVGLIGPNGAGKTTLFNAVGGYVRPQAGAVRLLGRDIGELPAHERALLGLGRTFQRGGLADNLSMLENLGLAQHVQATYSILEALARTPSVREQERLIAEHSRQVVQALGLEPLAELPVKHLSGGQRRIVEMACALVTSPPLLMLDEPSAGMAPAAVENLADALRDLRDTHGQTVLLIEHHVPLVLDVCDLVYVMDRGAIIASGGPDEIMANEHVLDAYLGASEAARVAVPA
ncbi:MAG: branched-chain amino acid ABC transporter ATP-binding protein/permease [Nitriliruptorales bacterium]|nr:branched-chain amino acid ABC transporter ATP-binding protein/permease [Nitriliruptorales bacterium]